MMFLKLKSGRGKKGGRFYPPRNNYYLSEFFYHTYHTSYSRLQRIKEASFFPNLPQFPVTQKG